MKLAVELTDFMISSNFWTRNVGASASVGSVKENPTQEINGDPLDDDPSTPWVLETLFRNCNYDLEWVADIIDPILTVQNYCQATALYVQGVVVQDRAFLSTNLNDQQTIHVTLCHHSWLIGQGAGCALAIAAKGVAADHALLRFDPKQGFTLVDLGSAEGTRINHGRIIPGRPYPIQDGDLVELGALRFEFFQELCVEPLWHPELTRDREEDRTE